MRNYTHQTAPTQFLEANGIRFAYRRFGKAAGVPLVFNQHYLGTIGGMVAQEIALQAPDLVRKLILLGISCPTRRLEGALERQTAHGSADSSCSSAHCAGPFPVPPEERSHRGSSVCLPCDADCGGTSCPSNTNASRPSVRVMRLTSRLPDSSSRERQAGCHGCGCTKRWSLRDQH
jgi:hypothetical protein